MGSESNFEEKMELPGSESYSEWAFLFGGALFPHNQSIFVTSNTEIEFLEDVPASLLTRGAVQQ